MRRTRGEIGLRRFFEVALWVWEVFFAVAEDLLVADLCAEGLAVAGWSCAILWVVEVSALTGEEFS